MLSFVKNYKTNVQCPIFKNYLWFADFFKGFLILCQSCQDMLQLQTFLKFLLLLSQNQLSQIMTWKRFLTDIYFSTSLKFGACYITGQWGKFKIKNATLYCHLLFWHFDVVFHQKICLFIIFISFYDEVSDFHKIILTNQKHELVVQNYHWNCIKETKLLSVWL